MQRVPVLAPILLVLLGCGLFVPTHVTVEPRVKLAKKTIVVVPFSDSRHAYFASPDGTELAQLIIREVRQGAPKATVVELDELRRLYGGQDLGSLGWQTVGAALGADYVLVGRINSFTLRDPRSPGFLLGNIALEVKLVMVADGSVVLSPPLSETTYDWSETGSPEIGTPEFDTTPEKTRQGTLQEAARRIGDFLCPRQVTQAEAIRRQHSGGRMLSP